MHAMWKDNGRISIIRKRITTFTLTRYKFDGVSISPVLYPQQNVGIDVFWWAKWAELIAPPTKSSANVARAFIENILSRFGVTRSGVD